MYEDYYNIKGSPFRLSPDPSFFFGSKGHNRALAYLQYGLKRKEGFIAITGSPGTGKTTLSRALLQDIARKKIVVAEINTTHLEAEDVLRMVAASFGLEFEGAPKATLLKRLEAHFLSRHRAGYHVLLIVDEAQNLPFESIEELRMLSNFYSGKHALIQIFLLGQEQLRERLYSKKLEQLRQRIVASCHLEPLNQRETQEYIVHRLKQVGWQEDPQITDRAFARIYTVTKGVPRRINTFCDRLFLFGFLEGLHQLKDEHVKSVATELMYEVSAKDVQPSDIKAGDESGKSDSTVESELIDSEQLQDFSDDLPSIVLVEKTEAPVELPTKPDPASEANNASERQTVRVFTGSSSNVAVEYEVASIVSDDVGSKPDWWKLVALAVDYYYNPLRHKSLSSSNSPLPEGGGELLKIAVGKIIMPTHMRIDELSDVSDETLSKACTNYIQKTWLTSKANYYRRLGVQPDADLALIRTHYRHLFRLLQVDHGFENTDQDETYVRRVNQAFSALRSKEKRAEYDSFLSTIDKDKSVASETGIVPGVSVASVTEEQTVDHIAEPIVETQAKKRSGVLLSFAIIMLLAGGAAAAVYYFQPNVDEIKVKLFSLFQSADVADEPSSVLTERLTNSDETPPFPVTVFPSPLAGSSEIDKVTLDGSEGELEPPLLISEFSETDGAAVVVEKLEKTVKPKVAAKPERVAKPAVVAKPEEVAKPAVVAKPEKVAKPVVVAKPEKVAKPVVAAKPDKIVKTVKPSQLEKPKLLRVAEPSDKELSGLIGQFSLAYEAGELNKFMGLFSKEVLTNNDEGWSNIRKDYKSLFRTTEMRVIEIDAMDWIIKDQSAAGQAEFVVTVLRMGGDETRRFEGQIKLEVEKSGGELLIKGMYHSYGND